MNKHVNEIKRLRSECARSHVTSATRPDTGLDNVPKIHVQVTNRMRWSTTRIFQLPPSRNCDKDCASSRTSMMKPEDQVNEIMIRGLRLHRTNVPVANAVYGFGRAREKPLVIISETKNLNRTQTHFSLSRPEALRDPSKNGSWDSPKRSSPSSSTAV